MKLGFIILTWSLIYGCKTNNPETSQSKNELSQENLLLCDDLGYAWDKCRLKDPEVKLGTVDDIQSEVRLTYDFPCYVGSPKTSPLLFRIGDTSSHPLVFQTKSEIVLIGKGDIWLYDSDPWLTKNHGFDRNHPCALTIPMIQIQPSNQQIATWTEKTKSLVASIKLNLEMYRFRVTLRNWYATMVSDPERKSALEQVIEDLRSSGDPLDKLKADSLHNIITSLDAPDIIFSPINDAKNNLIELREQSLQHMAALQKWAQAINDELITLEQDAVKELGI